MCLNVRLVTRFALQVTSNYSKYSQIAESTYTRVIPLMMQFLVLICISTYTRGRLIHEYIRYVVIYKLRGFLG